MVGGVIAALASLLAPVPDGGSPPSEIVVLPAGPALEARDGRRWTLADPAEVARRSNAALGGQEAVVDYEHQSLAAPDNGRPAPAAGWISRYEARPDGAIAARVRWTERAAKMLRAGEYRYVSPVFRYEGDGRIIEIVSVGLTNTPALPDIPAVARRRFDDKEESMTLKELLALLGLGEDADKEAVEAALAKARDEALAKARAAVAKAAGLAEDADAAAVAAGVAALRAKSAPKDPPKDPAGPDPAEWAPRAEFDALAKRLAGLETDTAAAKAEAAVDAATAAGKITPASREWALGYARKDPDGFGAYVEAAPVLLASGEQAPPPKDGKAALDAAALAACRITGVSQDDYRAELARRAA